MQIPLQIKRLTSAFLASSLIATSALAATAQTQQKGYEQQAGKTASADRGKAFFLASHGQEWRCSTCHGERPNTEGKHVVTGRLIKPLAPSANAERFTSEAQTEKWFRRNCQDVLKRECTDLEKADVIAFLKTF